MACAEKASWTSSAAETVAHTRSSSSAVAVATAGAGCASPALLACSGGGFVSVGADEMGASAGALAGVGFVDGVRTLTTFAAGSGAEEDSPDLVGSADT